MELEMGLWWQSVNPFLQNNNLIGYWPGLINAAGQIIDFSHNQRHLTNSGVTAVTASPPHHLNFSSGDYLELTSPPTIIGDFTFGGWFKFATPTTETALITKGSLNGFTGDHQALYLVQSASWITDGILVRGPDDDDVMFSGIFSQSVPINQWCFLAGGVREGSPNTYILRINSWGEDVIDNDLGNNLGNSFPLRIGTDNSGNHPYIGQAAKLWAVAEAFDQNMLNDIYNHQKHRFGV